VWENTDAFGNIKPLNFDKSSLSVEEVSLPPAKKFPASVLPTLVEGPS
jgi:hypothetical protein